MVRHDVRDHPVTAVLALSDCVGRGPDVGGKASGLGSLVAQGFAVPPGFCVTTHAYRQAVVDGGIQPQIDELLATADFTSDNSGISARIGELFEGLILPESVAAAISEAYEGLGDDVPYVAVRSSATAEDLADASFAGQQETYLYVRGADEVRKHVVRCWASLFSTSAIGYRSRFNVEADDLAMAVVVQKMVPAEAAGMMMTLNPVTGDPSRVFIEAAYGLGEGVVRGDVGVDRFQVVKGSLEIVDRAISPKEYAYRYAEDAGSVRPAEVPAEDQNQPCLSDAEIADVARLGERVEEAFGGPMDVEWAVTGGTPGEREVLLLQARPETVWSQRKEQPPADAGEPFDPFDEWDPLHTWSDVDSGWTTSDIGDAMPGVMTPLGCTLWRDGAERAVRTVVGRLGLLPDVTAEAPELHDDWIVRSFYGRIAWQVDILAAIGDRVPGGSAERVGTALLARESRDLAREPAGPVSFAVARRAPVTALRSTRRLRDLARTSGEWYRNTVPRIPELGLAQARAVVAESAARFTRIQIAQGCATFAVIQPLYDALIALVDRIGVGDVRVLSGARAADVNGRLTDLWEASRGRLDRDELLLRHGFHGPGECEVSSRSWREDPAALERMLGQYVAHADADSPVARERVARLELERMRAAVLAAVPRWRRPAVWVLLKLAARQIPLRRIAKRGVLQSIDACRAAARHVGTLLARDGVLDEPGDVFYLTVAELSGDLPGDARGLVACCRERRAAYERLVIPRHWQGMPRATPVAQSDMDSVAERAVPGDCVEPDLPPRATHAS